MPSTPSEHSPSSPSSPPIATRVVYVPPHRHLLCPRFEQLHQIERHFLHRHNNRKTQRNFIFYQRYIQVPLPTPRTKTTTRVFEKALLCSNRFTKPPSLTHSNTRPHKCHRRSFVERSSSASVSRKFLLQPPLHPHLFRRVLQGKEPLRNSTNTPNIRSRKDHCRS